MDQNTQKPISVSPPVSQPQNKSSDDLMCCGSGTCGKCLKGGMPMKKELLSFLALGLLVLLTITGVLYIKAKREILELARKVTPVVQEKTSAPPLPTTSPRSYQTTIALPKPRTTGSMAVEKALATRRSRRVFSEKLVTLSELSQMLWAGQGITVPNTNKRTAPSARESYPMTLFVVVRRVDGLTAGVYEYLPKDHALGRIVDADVSDALKSAGVQEGAQKAPVVFLVSAAIGDYQAKTKSTTDSATYMEAGHIGQNLYLQAESLGMATVAMAGFDSKKVGAATHLDPALTTQYLFPFGHPGVEVIAEQ